MKSALVPFAIGTFAGTILSHMLPTFLIVALFIGLAFAMYALRPKAEA